MENKKLTKQVKWICPNPGCGNFRMLNAGARPATIALCHNPACELAMMIPENQKMIKSRPEKKIIQKKPMICSVCGSPEVYCLTIIRNEYHKITDEVCYHCLNEIKSPYILNKEIVEELTEEEDVEGI